VTKRNTHHGDANAVTFAAVLVLLTGCVFVFRGDETRIGERVAADRRILAQLASAERTLHARTGLERERDGLRARLRTVDLDGDRTAIAARFVRDAAGIAARHHTTIASIAAVGPAGGPASASVTASRSAPSSASASAQRPGTPVVPAALSPSGVPGVAGALADTFEALPLDLTVEGRYADVLATIGALSADRVPTVVDVASLARKQVGSPDPTVSAQVHVTIERLAPATPTSAATRPA
jgi:hypothetical protein